MFSADFLVFCSILSAAWCQSVQIPKTLNTTSGSCVLIPCQMTTLRESVLDNSPVVSWRRGSLWKYYDTNYFTSTHRQKEPETRVIGDLRKKNCTSVMRNLTSQHSDRYFFRIQTTDYTFTDNKAVRITVSDSLPEPNVIVPVLREGELANLTCTVPAPCPSLPPNVTWAPVLSGNITQGTWLNADGTQSAFAIWEFVPSFTHHELKVNCASIHPVDGGDKQASKQVILSVEYPPKETRFSPPGLVWLGDNLTLTCQSNANPPADHSWFMKREGVEEKLGDSPVLSFIATQEKTGEYICEAQNIQGAMNSTSLHINIKGISFTTFLSILVLLSVLIFLLFLILIIHRRCKAPHRQETTQVENIYANSSAVKSQQLQPNNDIYNIKPEFTFEKSQDDRNIYVNY
ncbi:sialic acid-binding Ig-like lectin 13 [Danio aesculapii]|uniref:sialic acid-binding Ig-like lectin 13 n=1 Tax=Danio aesculapii TaxID=1142201 RepID=UPI0024C0A862|nr:sialic acid-binding Ig-like lectin 13 [Danio aesculapii]XP_056333800.1 sialic acid-binding Ig-like lectin 13 [Danio aesculapii]